MAPNVKYKQKAHIKMWKFEGVFGFIAVSPKMQGVFASNTVCFTHFSTFVTIAVPFEDQETSR